ncbi:porin family protein [Bradyrhizobium sp. 76]|nr:porin family protein [Bradyrhizobium sp. 76]
MIVRGLLRFQRRENQMENKMNRKILLGTVGLLALGLSSASAADLGARPYKAAPIAAPMMYDWSGFYIGANGGYGWSRQCVDVTGVNGAAFGFAEGCKDAEGGIVGGQVGYRWQSAAFVFGLEAQGDWANLRNERPSLFAPGNTWKTNINGLGLFTGQVGYAWNNTLLYVKGGAAVANQRFDLFNTATGIGIAQAERTRWGGVVGVGVEYGFSPNWTAGIEYDYLFRTNGGNTFATPGLAPITSISADTRTDVSMITGRISYKFGGYGAPIAARY